MNARAIFQILEVSPETRFEALRPHQVKELLAWCDRARFQAKGGDRLRRYFDMLQRHARAKKQA